MVFYFIQSLKKTLIFKVKHKFFKAILNSNFLLFHPTEP